MSIVRLSVRFFVNSFKYSKTQGLEFAMILPAAESIWIHPSKFPLERAEKIYDQMAKRRGYSYNRKLIRYIKAFGSSNEEA